MAKIILKKVKKVLALKVALWLNIKSRAYKRLDEMHSLHRDKKSEKIFKIFLDLVYSRC